MKFEVLLVIAVASWFVTSHLARAAPFREGVIASTGKDGSEVVAFAFVECHGKLMFDFAKDEELNEIQERIDGSLVVKFNNNKAQLTIFQSGKMKNKKGKVLKWRILGQSELIGPLSKRLAKAQAKCN